jgi:hypothetical protein
MFQKNIKDAILLDPTWTQLSMEWTKKALKN